MVEIYRAQSSTTRTQRVHTMSRMERRMAPAARAGDTEVVDCSITLT